MKIAEALTRLKDLKGKFSKLQDEIHSNATFQQLDPTEEVPNTESVLSELVNVSAEISSLKTRVTRTNILCGLSNKIYEMEHLKSCITQLEPLTKYKQVQTVMRGYEADSGVMKNLATFDVKKLADKVQSYRESVRALDLELQRLNWEKDLVE